MDQKFNTSFIPKKFLTEDVQSGSPNKYIKHRTVMGPGYFIAVLIFIVTVGAAVALFVYTGIVEKGANNKRADLEAKVATIKSEDLEEFLELEHKINMARTVLNNHVAVSEVLHKLEEKTLRDVRYTALSLQAPGNQNPPSVTLLGLARTFPDVALQMREYMNDISLTEPSLTSLSRTEEDLVSFSVTTNLTNDLVSYEVATREGRHSKSNVRATPETSQPASAPILTQ